MSIQDDSPYHYVPSRAAGIIFVVLFCFSTLLHSAQAAFKKTWWLFPTIVFSGLVEILGWSARLWSSYSPLLLPPFQIEITGTIVGPTPLLAASFVAFGKIIDRLGPQYSRLRPKWYTIVFCSCDVVSLVVQGAGGGIAATADTRKLTKIGSNIVLAGIGFQLAVIVVFSLCMIEFFIRYHRRAPIRKEDLGASAQHAGVFTQRLKILMYATSFTTLVLFIRAVYRTIELTDGWNGRIISTQVYFNVLDGAMVVLAFYAYNIAHPGLLLETPPSQAIYEKPETVTRA
ncbi:RTA1 like protein-domain-containing protein [Crepidotus variabilis]|uniref:RTA1 like protein-domain-containing protein n=1 Tax=Crepidotus variabilis TaxID=179855 RepID=A0A9P6ER94_9AGAR|nr:RTA1 like protein-domain-containing protein [Crepidotus variabilis]